MNTEQDFWTKYQDATQATAIYPGAGTPEGLQYVSLGLMGEVGEVSEHAKKTLRDDAGIVSAERREKLKMEIGDVLYYVARLCTEKSYSLQTCVNKSKLFPPEQVNFSFPVAVIDLAYNASQSLPTFTEEDVIIIVNCLEEVAYSLKLDMQEIANANIAKLSSRKERGTLHGSGSER